MGDIQIAGLIDQKKREFKCQGTSLDRFEQDFVDATNRSISRINVNADLAAPISRIASATGSITLDDIYEHVLSDCITYFLLQMGQRPAKGTIPKTEEQIDNAIDSIRQKILQGLQDAESAEDDSSYDNVGLGALDA